MIDGTPWRVTDEGADAVDAAVIVNNNGGEVLGVSEWARIDDKPLADIVRAVNAHDALVAALGLVKSMRTVDGLAPAVQEFEHAKRREAWAKVDSEIDAALALARGEG